MRICVNVTLDGTFFFITLFTIYYRLISNLYNYLLIMCYEQFVVRV